ncbi:MAG: hypothetical protein DBY45_10420 [Clostridiales bacterium]|nr:MAG: hypothetical protein DBY45_10420 [Clostridiales bacterium]
MATNTPNYNLKKPAPSDFYNIADFNGNADIIDAQMKVNANAAQNALEIGMDAAVMANRLSPKVAYTLTCTKSGKVYTLGNPDKNVSLPVSGLVSCLFKVPSNADYAAGDTFKMDNTTYAVATSDGEELPDKAFVSGAVVPAVLDQTSKTINFKQAGRKLTLSASSYVIVQCFTENGTFVAPMTGKYRVTCIGKGGDGDNAHYSSGYALNGAGGGAGGAASGIFSIPKGNSYTVTVDNAVSSFGIVMTASAGQKGQFNANQGGITATIAGGSSGTISLNMGENPVAYTGQSGANGEAANMGVPVSSGQWKNSDGGDGGAYSAGQSKFLPTAGGKGGSYQVDDDLVPLTYQNGLPPCQYSSSGLYPFGAGGGGGMYRSSGWTHRGGSGGSGAVIIELVLD